MGMCAVINFPLYFLPRKIMMSAYFPLKIYLKKYFQSKEGGFYIIIKCLCMHVYTSKLR